MLAFSPVPGLVQFLGGRNSRGFVLLALGMAGLNGVAVLGPGLRPESASLVVVVLAWAVLAGAMGASVLDTVRHVILLDRGKLAREKRLLLERGIECYLRRDVGTAALHFGELVNLDPQDADSRIYLASSLREKGDAAGARKNFKRAAALNSAKWSWEAGEALRELSEK
jgi:hypothetical protein